MTTMTRAQTRYHILSLSGQILSTHRTVAAAARTVEKHNGWQHWSIAREDRHPVTGKWSSGPKRITEEDHREIRAIRYPALTEYDGEPPA